MHRNLLLISVISGLIHAQAPAQKAYAQAEESAPAEGAPVPAADQPTVTPPSALSAPEAEPEPEPILEMEKTEATAPALEKTEATAPALEKTEATVPATTTVTAEKVPSEASQATSAEADEFDLASKPYNRERPNWAFDLAYSPSGLGVGGALPGGSSAEVRSVRGLTTQVEWQPSWIQAIGVIGVGVGLQVYSRLPAGGVTPQATSVWSASLQARYQLKFFEGQWVVPMGGYAVERVQYNLGGERSFFLAQGPFVGAMILLNPLEPSVAGDAYVSLGIKRTYLMGELRLREGRSASGVALGENAIFAGIRSEW